MGCKINNTRRAETTAGARELYPSEPLPCASVKRARKNRRQATSHHDNIPCAIGPLQGTNILFDCTPTLISPLCATLSWTLRATRNHRNTFGNTQIGTLDPEKENRYPRSMSAANSSQDARKSLGRNTPGRRGRTGNQYFDVGKVGR
jgi:hypothetical protein